MKLIKEGKTKNVYELPDGNYLLKLKDDATGKDGVFDPGENSVGLTIAGLGRKSLELTKYYFEKLNGLGIPTHYISCDLDEVTMTARPAELFKNGLEVVCRLKAAGSFIKRYGAFIKEGAELDSLVEFTLKDDGRGDPPITKDTLSELGIMTGKEFKQIKKLTKKITGILKKDMAENGLDLYDIKFEFGKIDGKIALIDEISGGSMRVFHNGKIVEPTGIGDYLIK